jgi:hypothetical protein
VQEEREPRKEIAALAREEQVVVVLAAVLLEIGGEVEQWLGQRATEDQHQGDEQPTDAPVAVEERVDHLELVVRERQLHQQRQVVLVQEPFEVRQRHAHLLRGRGHEHRIGQRVAADPHRTGPQLAWPAVLAPYAAQQELVHLTQQPNRDREAAAHPVEPVLHRDHVVAHLARVVGLVGRRCLPRLEAEQLAHIRPRTLDPGAEDRLESKVWADQQVWVRDQPPEATKAVDRTGGLVEQDHGF